MYSTNVPALMEPFKLGDLHLSNRVVMAPMTRARAGEERLANARMAEYYAQRASAGLIISEGVVISEDAIGWLNTPGIWSKEQTESWKPVVDDVHKNGSHMFLQLWHCGRASHSTFHGGRLPSSASAIAINEPYIHAPGGKVPYEVPAAMSKDDIMRTVEDYVDAARNAKSAGFDGVEIHSGNGYLLDTFLQSKTNQRTDEFGGTPENRFRFPRMVVEAVMTVFDSKRVGFKIAPNTNYNDMGAADFRETFTYVAAQLDGYSLGYLQVVDGVTFGAHDFGEPMVLNEFREVYHGPLMGNCGYTRDAAELAIRDKRADLVAFGRPFISNPDLVERFQNNWPLNDSASPKLWYSFDTMGYTDFPTHPETKN